jgi:hypothetical protein
MNEPDAARVYRAIKSLREKLVEIFSTNCSLRWLIQNQNLPR